MTAPAGWQDQDTVPATEAEIARLVALAPGPLPADYLDFLRRHGFANWDISVPDRFTYRLAEGGGTVTRDGFLTHLWTPPHIRRLRDNAWSDDPARGFPVAPDRMFPIAGTAGEDLILLDLEEGGIWFLPEGRQDRWGTGDNTQLGFVAPGFGAFIEGLQPDAAA